MILYFVYSDFFFLKKYFLFKDIGADTINYAYTNFVQISRYLRSNGIPSWDFTQGIGQNIFPFMLGDPFADILYLFDKEFLHKIIIYIESGKILLGSILFYLYLLKLRLRPSVCITGAIVFSFSSYMVVGGTWYQFSTEAVYAAFLLLAYEKYWQDGNPILLPLPFALIAGYQPFNLYWYGLMILVYSYIRTSQRYNFAEYLQHIGKTTMMAFLGALISGIFLLPNLYQYLNSSRGLGDSSFLNQLSDIKNLFQFSPLEIQSIFARLFSSDLLGNGSHYTGWDNYLESPMLYTGLFVLFMTPQFIYHRIRKVPILTVFIFVLISLSLPYLRNSLWLFSGNYYRTYSFIVSLIFLVTALKSVDQIEENNHLNFRVLFYSLFVTAIILILLTSSNKVYIDRSVLVLVILFLVMYFLILVGIHFKSDKLINVFLLLMICEAGIFANISISGRSALEPVDFTKGHNYKDGTVDALEAIRKIDSGFYRLTKDYYSSQTKDQISYNDSKVQNYFGLASYNSFNQMNYVRFLDKLDVIDAAIAPSTIWIDGPVNRPIIMSLLSTKYYLSLSQNSDIERFRYQRISDANTISIFRNQNVLPLGFAYTHCLSETDHQTLNPFEKDYTLLKSCVVEDNQFQELSSFSRPYENKLISEYTLSNYDEDIKMLKSHSFIVDSFSDNFIQGNIELDESGILYFSIPFDPGWRIRINGEYAEPVRINYGFIGLPLPPGHYNIELKYNPPLVRTGLYVSIFSILIYLGLVVVFKKDLYNFEHKLRLMKNIN